LGILIAHIEGKKRLEKVMQSKIFCTVSHETTHFFEIPIDKKNTEVFANMGF
jgi:hypothetical protein